MLNLTPKRRKSSAKVEQNLITTKPATNFFLRKNENNSKENKIWHAEMAESPKDNLKPGLAKRSLLLPLSSFYYKH